MCHEITLMIRVLTGSFVERCWWNGCSQMGGCVRNSIPKEQNRVKTFFSQSSVDPTLLHWISKINAPISTSPQRSTKLSGQKRHAFCMCNTEMMTEIWEYANMCPRYTGAYSYRINQIQNLKSVSGLCMQLQKEKVHKNKKKLCGGTRNWLELKEKSVNCLLDRCCWSVVLICLTSFFLSFRIRLNRMLENYIKSERFFSSYFSLLKSCLV